MTNYSDSIEAISLRSIVSSNDTNDIKNSTSEDKYDIELLSDTSSLSSTNSKTFCGRAVTVCAKATFALLVTGIVSLFFMYFLGIFSGGGSNKDLTDRKINLTESMLPSYNTSGVRYYGVGLVRTDTIPPQ